MRRILIISILFISFFSFFSCKKKEEKIVGTWQFVYLQAADTGKIQTWKFNEDKSIVREIQFTDTLIVDSAIYSFEPRFLSSPNLKVNELHPDLDGTYEILTLNKKYLIIQRILNAQGSSQGVFFRTEFVKK